MQRQRSKENSIMEQATDTLKQAVRSSMPVMSRLEAAGYEAYLVGGSVREALIQGREGDAGADGPDTDLDIATNATPEEVTRVFSDWPVIETGIKHGTVMVLMPADTGDGSIGGRADLEENGSVRPVPVEVTTYRRDGKYSDGRRPDAVRFVENIEEDLSRRDFTVNAMAIGTGGELIDPFGGRKDLEEGIIRAVGDPRDRFEEDALRIIRALRFASVLGFEIEENTEQALLSRKHLLKNIAVERIYDELKKMISGRDAGRILRRYIDILCEVIPELGTIKGFDQCNPYHRYDVLEHCIRTMEAVRTTPENAEYMLMAALFHDIGKRETFSLDDEGIGHFYGHPAVSASITTGILRRLKAERSVIERVSTLIRYHDLVFQEELKLLRRWMGRYGPDTLFEILEIKRADNIATGNVTRELMSKFDRIENMMKKILEDGDCLRITDLMISGEDVIALGVEEGPEVGEILRALLDRVLDGDVLNEKDELIDEVRRLIRTMD